MTEGVWSSRYRYVDELKRMGARIQVDDKTAVVEGVEKLTGAPIQAYDLRAGAALVIAALAAEGESEISNVQYIERGYEDIIGKLRAWAPLSARWKSPASPRSWRPTSAEARAGLSMRFPCCGRWIPPAHFHRSSDSTSVRE